MVVKRSSSGARDCRPGREGGAGDGAAAGDRVATAAADPRAGVGPGAVRRGDRHPSGERGERSVDQERRDGTSRIYRADQEALGSLRAVVEEHWRGSLARLKALAEAEEQEKNGP